MDAFYASVEQRDNPTLVGKPVAVGHRGKRGVVAAASYEARKYGVHSAMASVTALRKCPHLIFVPARFDVYKNISAQIMEIFREYTDLVEPLSLDEAFLDVTENKMGMLYATDIAKEIKRKIKERTRLNASAGVSYNKFLAKIASDYNKPNGLCVITPRRAEQFIETLSIDKFYGVGRVTADKMRSLGIHTGKDLKERTLLELTQQFGKAGDMYYHFARGIDEREITAERIRKSLGAEETFEEDLYKEEDLLRKLEALAHEVMARADKRKFYCHTVTLKVKYADFSIISRSRTLQREVNNFETLFKIGKELLWLVEDIPIRKIRLMGLSLKISSSDIIEDNRFPRQLTIDFEEWRN